MNIKNPAQAELGRGTLHSSMPRRKTIGELPVNCYCTDGHVWHSDTLTGPVSGGTVLKRTTPSEVEQNLLVPPLLATVVPTTINSWHSCFLQTAVRRNRNPDFVHHVPAVQLEFPSVASIKLACWTDSEPAPRGSGPSSARSRAQPLCG